MKKVYLTLAFFLIGFILTAQKLPFQGYLEESGVPVNGTRTFNFELTDYGWTETIVDVPIDNGIYNVVLGQITLLPDTIFSNISETALSITVDSTNIGIVTLYKPLLNGQSLVGSEGSLIVRDPNGKVKADLNYFPTNNSGSLVLNGSNDSTNVILGSPSPGNEGALFLYDSLRNQHARLISRNRGGSFLVASRESGAFRSGVSIDAFPNNSNLRMFGTNTAQDQSFLMIDQYITPNAVGFGPEMSGNYQRSGTDWKDNEGTLLAAIGTARDENGSDPTGKSGYLSLWGTNSINVELTGKRWENNDLTTFNLFGNNDDGGGWWTRNAGLEVQQGPGTSNFADLRLYFTNNGGESNESVLISSNFLGSAAGGLELRDSVGSTTAILEARGNGNSGQLKLRGTTGLDVAAVQNRGGNSGQAVFYGPSGGLRAEVGSFGDDSGFLITYGPNGSKNVQLDRDAGNTNFGQFSLFGTDGISPRVLASAATDGTNEWGSITLDSPTEQIILNGQTSTITATTITASSDRRLKKNITNLENSLENTLKLRGASYYWKNENGSNKRQIGVIAQEVEEIYPEFVHTNDEGFKSVNYAQMTAVLIEAIKELNQKVDNLEKENEALSTALNDTKALSEKINKLEKLLMEDRKVASN